jgi:hypothetical protein
VVYRRKVDLQYNLHLHYKHSSVFESSLKIRIDVGNFLISIYLFIIQMHAAGYSDLPWYIMNNGGLLSFFILAYLRFSWGWFPGWSYFVSLWPLTLFVIFCVDGGTGLQMSKWTRPNNLVFLTNEWSKFAYTFFGIFVILFM